MLPKIQTNIWISISNLIGNGSVWIQFHNWNLKNISVKNACTNLGAGKTPVALPDPIHNTCVWGAKKYHPQIHTKSKTSKWRLEYVVRMDHLLCRCGPHVMSKGCDWSQDFLIHVLPLSYNASILRLIATLYETGPRRTPASAGFQLWNRLVVCTNKWNGRAGRCGSCITSPRFTARTELTGGLHAQIKTSNFKSFMSLSC